MGAMKPVFVGKHQFEYQEKYKMIAISKFLVQDNANARSNIIQLSLGNSSKVKRFRLRL